MYRYKNLSLATKTFYGVTFQPGDERDVPGYINSPDFVRICRLPEQNKIKRSLEISVTKKSEKPLKDLKTTHNKEEAINGTDPD